MYLDKNFNKVSTLQINVYSIKVAICLKVIFCTIPESYWLKRSLYLFSIWWNVQYVFNWNERAWFTDVAIHIHCKLDPIFAWWPYMQISFKRASCHTPNGFHWIVFAMVKTLECVAGTSPNLIVWVTHRNGPMKRNFGLGAWLTPTL